MKGKYLLKNRGVRLALACALLALLLFLGWLIADCPSLTAKVAFRRGVRNGMAGQETLELILEGDPFLKTLGIGSDNNRACTVEMSRAIVTGETKIGWKSGAVRSFPAAEGVRYVWLNARGSAPMIFDPGSLGKYGPIAAVKTESAQAELSLVLEEAPQNWKWISGTEQFVPATFRLTAKEQDGWTLFSVDYQALMESFDAHEGVWNKETPAYTAFCWLRRFLENGQVDRAELRDWPARFELTLRDGSGAAKTIILSP